MMKRILSQGVLNEKTRLLSATKVTVERSNSSLRLSNKITNFDHKHPRKILIINLLQC